MTTLLTISIGEGLAISIMISGWLWVTVLLILIGLAIYRIRSPGGRFSTFEIDEAELGLGQQKIKFKPNLDDLQIAFKLWTEIKTRKIGLPVDEDNDVIVEVYNSWYEFFGITRELIKSIPVSKLRKNESTQQIVRLSIRILNDEIRPHLTRWQARFRSWYARRLDANDEALTPQELQREYPEYEELISDLRSVNEKLVVYSNILHELVYES